MKFPVAILFLLGTIFEISRADLAKPCDVSKCTIKENCRCSSQEGPLDASETPQLIVLAFVDAAKDELYTKIWAPLVEPRINPDGAYISATFYINHEFSNYQIVHDLASIGFEIAVHSVTNNYDQDYWREAPVELLRQEFGSQRKIISKFANIPMENIIGVMTPQLQFAGDNSTTAFTAEGFVYDNTWPSPRQLFPYTFDYASDEECNLGAVCPKDSYPGFWEAPIVDLIAPDGDICNGIAACFRKKSNLTAEGFSDWLVGNVQRVKNTNRAPLTLIVEENLFTSVNNSWDGLVNALDKLQEDKEVFFVSQSRVLEWMKNPVNVSQFTTNPPAITSGCVKSTCNLKNSSGELRIMVSCVPCPNNYPWLDNPEGN